MSAGRSHGARWIGLAAALSVAMSCGGASTGVSVGGAEPERVTTEPTRGDEGPPVAAAAPEPTADTGEGDASRSGDAEAATTDAATATARPTPAPGDPIDIGCGRWRATLPAGTTATADEGSACRDRGYPGPIVARGVAGLETLWTLTHGSCALELSASEWVPAAPGPPSDAAPVVEVRAGPVPVLNATAPDGARLELGVELAPDAPTEPACVELAADVLAMVASTLRAAPLLTGGDVAAQISSAGHGIAMTLPAGTVLVSLGGAADERETAYLLRAADGTALATFYTSWDPYHEGRDGRFASRVVTRVRPPTDESYEPLEASEEPCATMTTGPIARLVVEVYLCGPSDVRASTLALLRQARFTPPPTGTR